MRAAGAAIGVLMGCGPSDEPILGRFEVIGARSNGVETDGTGTAAVGAGGAVWGRESWILGKDRVLIERKLLFPAKLEGHVACEVSVRVSAVWTGAVLTIPFGATSRARATGPEPVACEVSATPSEWRVTKLAGKPWDYEMTSGDRTLLLVAGTENADYASRLVSPAGAP